MGKETSSPLTNIESAAACAAVVTKVVHLIARDCAGDFPRGSIVQALLLAGCHFAREAKVPPEMLQRYIREMYPDSTQAVQDCLRAVFAATPPPAPKPKGKAS